MFSSDKNIETISQLAAELKRYVELRTHALQIDIVSKMTILLTAIVLAAVFFGLAAIVIIFLSFTLATALAPLVGGAAMGYLVIVVLYFLLGVLIYAKRHAWIEAPIADFLSALFLKDEGTADNNADSFDTNEAHHPTDEII